jgi:ubiquinone/menaquinone biosynthesis C-methylase UbiE
VERGLYKLQHQGLAVSTRVGYQLLHALLHPGAKRPSLREASMLARRFDELLEKDLDNVERGYYPRDLLYAFPLFDYLSRAPLAALDLPKLVWRRYRGDYEDLPDDVDRAAYPRYYLRNFHWQTDGWLSARSASLYDPGVEFLFGGTADVMRRMAIPAVVDAVRARGCKRPRVLDVGCGTGRFLSQLGSALPNADLYGLDLSPHYLAHAQRAVRANRHVNLIAENAESMPWADATFDVVTSVFMFHELPARVGRRVAAEMARVTKLGGTVVVCDSAQFSDSPDLRDVLTAFPDSYHEPFYKRYLRDDLAMLLAEAQLEVVSAAPYLVSKVVAARRQSADN